MLFSIIRGIKFETETWLDKSETWLDNPLITVMHFVSESVTCTSVFLWQWLEVRIRTPSLGG